jgi:hypothetical protein
VDESQTAHGCRRNHVEYHFMSRRRFHAGRSRKDFRSNLSDDSEVRKMFERRIRITSEGNGLPRARPG